MNSRTCTRWFLAAALALAAPAYAAPNDPASLRDLQRLQLEIENLDEELVALEESEPAAARRLQRRADDIRDDTVYLRDQLRRHQDEGRAGGGVTVREIEDLRRQVRSLRTDIDTASGDVDTRRGDARIPAGTELSARLEESLSSLTAVDEDRFRAVVDRPVRIDDTVVVPAGSEMRGIVRRAQAAERPQRAGRLELEFDSLYVDGRRVDIRTSLVSMQDEEAADEAKQKAGIGAVLGGVVGGILKGRTGALVGVLVGGGAIAAQSGEDVELPEGTLLQVRLERAATVPR